MPAAASLKEEVDIPPAGTSIGNSVILPKDPPSEPTQSEIEDYAKWMGMELPQHHSLLWIAKDALMAELPPNWRACQDESGGGCCKARAC